MLSKKAGAVWLGLLLVAAVFVLVGFVGAPVVANAATGDDVPPESCATCHNGAGDKHQASYDELYQDGVIQVTDMAYTFTAPDTTVVTFNMTKNGMPFDARQADSFGLYFAPYDGANFQFDPPLERLSLLGDLSYDGAGGNTSTLVGDVPDLTDTNGIIVLYGVDEIVGQLPARVRQGKYPFAGLLETGAGVDYVSPANDAGCVSCHTDPYLKHGYIYAEVNNDPGTDFYTCKACHLDNGEGGHFEWQLLVDDPALAAAVLAGEAELTPEQQEQYAYRTTLMNDVHMSHAMEFPYPQSMANCVTCHAGKLDTTLSDENFTVETCKSCHPVTGSEEHGTAERSLTSILAASDHDEEDLAAGDCTNCHETGSKAPGLSEIHTGYDKAIYTADGVRYSDVISVTIDSATFDGTTLDIAFSAGQSQEIEGVDATTIVPSIMVGLYGWDTKDFAIGPHERLFDDNGDGTIDGSDQRTLEYVVGEEHPRFTTVAADGGAWEVTADLSAWTDMIADGTVKRVEIAVMPELFNADEVQLALNAPSRTFDLGANAFVDDFYAPIAKATDGCNNCHDALATTFHSPDRGGNVVVCRMCHITRSGGSHLEMQSRSIDSYVHAIHSFQAFDIGDIDFSDPVAAMHYEHHIEFPYPTHGNTNCESCHVEGTFNVPDQDKSLPGILSASDEVTTWDRNIGSVPSYVTGPASRACGGCHRAELINEDEFSKLVSFNQHTKNGGYMVEAGEDPLSTWDMVVQAIMGIFN
ncbi:MAG: hypothetical protein KDD83_07750 [Caldilineaceae bacterium]|nr:hypothetical protein [Caldilineaceae bacterium]